MNIYSHKNTFIITSYIDIKKVSQFHWWEISKAQMTSKHYRLLDLPHRKTFKLWNSSHKQLSITRRVKKKILKNLWNLQIKSWNKISLNLVFYFSLLHFALHFIICLSPCWPNFFQNSSNFSSSLLSVLASYSSFPEKK